MSFAEMMVVLVFLSVMAFLIIAGIQKVVPSAKEVSSEQNLNQLNAAVLKFSQSNWELVLPADSSSDDESAIFRSLQYRNPARPTPGSPYLLETQSLVISADDSIYRAIWNGRLFEMVAPGAGGQGLDLERMSDQADAAVFDDEYKPVGAP